MKYRIIATIILTLLLLGCKASTVGQVTPNSLYDDYKAARASNNNALAQQKLEAAINHPSTSPRFKDALVNTITMHYLGGTLGQLDYDKALYWAGFLGNDLPASLKYRIDTVKNIYRSLQADEREAVDIRTRAETFCQEENQALSITPTNNKIRALQLPLALDCVYDHLHSSSEARNVYAKYLLKFGSRANSKEKARGFVIYQTESSQYKDLAKNDLKSLVSARKQVWRFLTDSEKLPAKFTMPSSQQGTLTRVMSLTRSTNDSDWIKIANDVDAIINDDELSKEVRASVASSILIASSFTKNRSIFQKYKSLVSELVTLTKGQKNYILSLELLQNEKLELYLENLRLLDVALSKQTDEAQFE
ncbi:MAG: hypothetical protein V2I33_09680 [Kangiellaceae bacterium]|jgi:hypothetical protein|nr:hypothetical protein [Kangiellaceae bacterium]